MLDHVSIGVSDFERSAAFYDTVLAALGYVRVWSSSGAAGYGRPGQTGEPFAIKQETGSAIALPGRLHVAFASTSRETVRAFHQAALAQGARDDGAPGIHAEYGKGYFASFVIDPDGYRLEAVHHEPQTALRVVTDEDFAWMLDGGEHPSGELRLPPAGLEYRDVALHVRAMVKRLRDQGCNENWMVVSGGEVVGLCGYKALPSNGVAEIGYNIAPSRRRLGHATRAVAALLADAQTDPRIQTVTAATLKTNHASQRVLSANGFEAYGTGRDEDGEIVLWRIDVS